MGHSSEQLHVPHTPRSKERSREKWGGSSWLGFGWNLGIQGWKSSPCSAQHGAENPGLRSDTRQEQTLQPSVGLMKGFLKSKISQGIKTNRAERVREAAGTHLGVPEVKGSDSGHRGSHRDAGSLCSFSFPGDFCAFAEPPGKCHPCLGWQQTWLFKGKHVMEPV